MRTPGKRTRGPSGPLVGPGTSRAFATSLPTGTPRARRGRRMLPLLLRLVSGAVAILVAGSLLAPRPAAELPFPEVGSRVHLLTAGQARRHAEKLLARIAGPPAVAVGALPATVAVGFGRAPASEWQVDCRTGAGPYFVRLDAATGQALSIAPETLRSPSEDGAADQPPASGEHAAPRALSPARVEALARRYVRLAGLALPPSASAARPQVRWIAGPLNPSCSVTFRFEPRRQHGGGRKAGEGEDDTTRSVRVDMDARDGSLHGLYRLRSFGQSGQSVDLR